VKVQKGERDLANRSSRSRVGGHPVGRGGGSVHLSTVRSVVSLQPAPRVRGARAGATVPVRRSHFSLARRRRASRARRENAGLLRRRTTLDAPRTPVPGGERPTRVPRPEHRTLGSTVDGPVEASTRLRRTPSFGFYTATLVFQCAPHFRGARPRLYYQTVPFRRSVPAPPQPWHHH
jgi:hypothetical protein